MDFFFLSGLIQHAPTDLVLSYDIACQWSVNLFERIAIYPEHLRPPHQPDNITFLVPKFHLPAHREKCRNTYSFNYTPKVAYTDGEAPERGWSAVNALASSTKEMGPGSRRDTLDDHFGDYNWRKVTTLGMLLRQFCVYPKLTFFLSIQLLCSYARSRKPWSSDRSR